MADLIRTFRADEDGAVTVDWVVFTAAIVGLGIAVLASVKSGATTMGENVKTELVKSVPTINWNQPG